MNNIITSLLKEKSKSVQRVYSFMRKGTWRHSEDIRRAAGAHLSDGLRRMRDLRDLGLRIERKRVPGSYQYKYRIVR